MSDRSDVNPEETELSITDPCRFQSYNPSSNDGDEESNTSADGTSFDDEDDQITSLMKESDNDADVDEPIKKNKKKKPRSSLTTMFPKVSIQKIVYAAYSKLPMDDECLLLLNKLVEVFLIHYTEVAIDIAAKSGRQNVEYFDLYQSIRTKKIGSMELRECIPRTHLYGKVKNLTNLTEKAEKEKIEDMV